MEAGSLPYITVFWTYPNCYVAPSAYFVPTAVTDYEPTVKTSDLEAIQEKTAYKSRVGKPNRNHRRNEKKNVRNIIPNISRKLINYLCSQKSSNVIRQINPSISVSDLDSFYEFARKLKNSMSFYIGNKDLLRIWYGGNEQPDRYNYYLMRVLSKHYLENECTNSILLSRRIKPSLKADHLKYRRKILKLLYSRPTNKNL